MLLKEKPDYSVHPMLLILSLVCVFLIIAFVKNSLCLSIWQLTWLSYVISLLCSLALFRRYHSLLFPVFCLLKWSSLRAEILGKPLSLGLTYLTGEISRKNRVTYQELKVFVLLPFLCYVVRCPLWAGLPAVPRAGEISWWGSMKQLLFQSA